jgi:tetratricopeptide (TPR) repeat protein
MTRSAPAASVLLIAALVAAIFWQAINLLRPHEFVMPTKPANDFTATAAPAGGSFTQQNGAPGEPAPPAVPNAQTSPAAPEAAQSSSTVQSGEPAVDETALRYFARQGDTRRLNAEIARLHALYPSWTPPADPLQAPPVADPQLDRLWSLYAKGQFAQVRASIAERQSADPKWAPPKELTERLDLNDARDRLVNASDAKQYATVVQILAATPNLRNCDDVDVLWRVAEAFAATERESRAVDAYRYILTNCADGQQRVPTMQKAALVLPRSDVDELLALGRKGAEGDEFQIVREDLARRAVAEAGSQPNAKASEADVAMLEKAAEHGRSPSDPRLLGWYWLRRDDATKAENWFRTSYERENAAEPAEGLALALILLKKPAEAEAVLARWRDADDGAAKTYLSTAAALLSEQPPPVLASEVLSRIADSVVKRRDAVVAQLLGWYSHAFRQDDTAARWFGVALDWKPDHEPSAYGLAIANLSLNRRAALQAIERTWSSRSLRIAALTNPAAARELAARSQPTQIAPAEMGDAPGVAAAPPVEAAAPAGPAVASSAPPPRRVRPPAKFVASAERATRSDAPGPPDPWRLLNLGRPAEAAAAFNGSLSRGSQRERDDAAYGMALAYLQLNLPTEANNAARLVSQDDRRGQQLRTSILSQKIVQDYESGHYSEALIGLDQRGSVAPETVDLMMLRGWSYYHLRRYEEAQRVFEALAASGHEGATSALDTARAALKYR